MNRPSPSPSEATTEPRTISGKAWLSGMRPHHRRAATPLILSIEREAAKRAMDALRAADEVLAGLAELDAADVDSAALGDLVERAGAAHADASRILEQPDVGPTT
jgi:hypothetical protein